MKLKIICVFLFTFYGFKVTANVDSIIVNAKNYINYKLVEYYLIKYTSEGANKDSVQFNKDKNSFGKIKNILESKSIFDNNNYDSLSILLTKNDWKATDTNIALKINNISITDFSNLNNTLIRDSLISLALDRYNSIVKKKSQLVLDSTSELTQKLRSDIILYLDSVNKVEINDIVQVEPEKNNLSFWEIHFWQILFFICLGLLLLSLLKNHMNNLRQKPNSRNGKFEDFERKYKELERKYKELEFKNNELLNKLRKCDESNTILKSKLDKLKPSSTDVPKVNELFFEIKNSEQNTLYPNTEIFYMTGPVTNYFPLTAKKQTKESTVYKFIIQNDKTIANFEIHTGGASANEIAKRNETLVKPACEELNTPSASVQNIITNNQGIAHLEVDKWVIDKKAIITYE